METSCVRSKIKLRLLSACSCPLPLVVFWPLNRKHDIRDKIIFILFRYPGSFSVQSSPSPRSSVYTCTLHVRIDSVRNERRGISVADRSSEDARSKHDQLSFVLVKVKFSPSIFQVARKGYDCVIIRLLDESRRSSKFFWSFFFLKKDPPNIIYFLRLRTGPKKIPSKDLLVASFFLSSKSSYHHLHQTFFFPLSRACYGVSYSSTHETASGYKNKSPMRTCVVYQWYLWL